MFEGWCEGNLGRIRRVPQGFTTNPDGSKKGAWNQKKKGVIVEADSREENENARQEEDTLLVED